MLIHQSMYFFVPSIIFHPFLKLIFRFVVLNWYASPIPICPQLSIPILIPGWYRVIWVLLIPIQYMFEDYSYWYRYQYRAEESYWYIYPYPYSLPILIQLIGIGKGSKLLSCQLAPPHTHTFVCILFLIICQLTCCLIYAVLVANQYWAKYCTPILNPNIKPKFEPNIEETISLPNSESNLLLSIQSSFCIFS